MTIHNRILRKNEKGATAVYVAVVLALLLMFAALGVDVNYLYGVRNELHNAADAGSLAGASKLFNSDSELTRAAAIAEAKRIVAANKTGNEDVVAGTVETGHWSFAGRTFTASENTTQLAGWQEMKFSELDGNPAFINAVRVQTERVDTPSFFAKILGFADFFVRADAVAYIGFPGKFYPGELDLPIALCEDTITQSGAYDCNIGRMLNSGGNPNTNMTAMWTDFSQNNPADDTQNSCDTADAKAMKDITETCSPNTKTIVSGLGVGTVNGVQDVVLGNVVDCWIAAADSDGDKIPDKLWPVVLPVIECGVSNTCSPLVGAVEVNIVWIQHKNDPWSQMKDVPTKMADWECTTTGTVEERRACWKDFVDHFNLQNVSGPPVTDKDYEDMYQKKAIYFLPECEPREILGGSGGENFGIMAKIPKLVK